MTTEGSEWASVKGLSLIGWTPGIKEKVCLPYYWKQDIVLVYNSWSWKTLDLCKYFQQNLAGSWNYSETPISSPWANKRDWTWYQLYPSRQTYCQKDGEQQLQWGQMIAHSLDYLTDNTREPGEGVISIKAEEARMMWQSGRRRVHT